MFAGGPFASMSNPDWFQRQTVPSLRIVCRSWSAWQSRFGFAVCQNGDVLPHHSPFGPAPIPLSMGASLRDTTARKQIAPFGRRTGQPCWTRCNGHANHRQDLDDRAKNVDARAGRQRVARGKVRRRTGCDRSTSTVLRSQTSHGFRKPGAPPNLRRSVHAQWLTGSGKRNSVRCQ